jgi:hypothetical protein
MTPRAAIGSSPYSLVCEDATGDITPRSVSIADYGQVIDKHGNWLGKPPGTTLWIDGSNVVSTTAGVGIGTGSPSAQLHVAGNENAGYVSILIENVGTSGAELALKSDTARYSLTAGGSGTNFSGNLLMHFDRGGPDEWVPFAASSENEFVGIGTSDPLTALDIRGRTMRIQNATTSSSSSRPTPARIGGADSSRRTAREAARPNRRPSSKATPSAHSACGRTTARV